MQTTRVEDLWVYVDPFHEPSLGAQEEFSDPILNIPRQFILFNYADDPVKRLPLLGLTSHASFLTCPLMAKFAYVLRGLNFLFEDIL